MQLFHERPHVGAAGLRRAEEFYQKLRVVGVGEELDFAKSLDGFSRCFFGYPDLPQRADAAIDQRRTDRALLDGHEFMGSEFEISGGESGFRPNLQARAVAIVPGRRRVHLDFALQFELGDPAQIFAEDFFFNF